jgi:hypothetical protein
MSRHSLDSVSQFYENMTIVFILFFCWFIGYAVYNYLEYIVYYFAIMICLALIVFIPRLIIELYILAFTSTSTKHKKYSSPLPPLYIR